MMEKTKISLPRVLNGSQRTRSQLSRRTIMVSLDIKLTIHLENEEKTDKGEKGEK
jgi:hypothetical protein